MRVGVPIMHSLFEEFSSRVNFLCVYIAEAHAMDEWPINSARGSITGQPINFNQPISDSQRLSLAIQFVSDYQFLIPTVIDLIDNAFEEAFASWPLRFFVVRDGKLVFKAQPRDTTYYFSDLRDFLIEHAN